MSPSSCTSSFALPNWPTRSSREHIWYIRISGRLPATHPPQRQGMSLADGVALCPRILGLDPGLQVTGYAVLEAGPRICEAGILRSSEGRAPADMAPRLRALYDSIVEVVN